LPPATDICQACIAVKSVKKWAGKIWNYRKWHRRHNNCLHSELPVTGCVLLINSVGLSLFYSLQTICIFLVRGDFEQKMGWLWTTGNISSLLFKVEAKILFHRKYRNSRL